jgi:hypothetical protein
MHIRKYSLQAALALLVFMSSGCAVGNMYRYHEARAVLPLVKPEQTVAIGLAGSDQRPYIVSGHKSPDFVGLQRGGFGNPFDVKTASRRPFIEDVLAVMATSLDHCGYQPAVTGTYADIDQFAATMRDAGLAKGVLLTIREWKTDIFMSVSLQYDLHLAVLDASGRVIAESRQTGDETIGGARMEKDNSEAAKQALAAKLSYLFLDAAVQQALQ